MCLGLWWVPAGPALSGKQRQALEQPSGAQKLAGQAYKAGSREPGCSRPLTGGSEGGLVARPPSCTLASLHHVRQLLSCFCLHQKVNAAQIGLE